MSAEPEAGARPDWLPLRRQLGLLDAVALVVGIVLGSGIFVAPKAVAAAAPHPLGSALLWVAGGVVFLCGGLVYAECGARLPHVGGFFVFYREAFGDAPAFVAGWAALLVTYPASIAAIAHVFADYLAEVVPRTAGHAPLVSAGLIAAAGVVNAIGVRRSAWTQRILTGAKVAALAALCGAALVAGARPALLGPQHDFVDVSLQGYLRVILAAVMVIMWTYDGWSDTPLVAGELRDPGRTLGRTILVSAGLLVVLYIAVQLCVMALLPPEVAATSKRVVADAVQAGLGPGAGRVVALLVVLTTAASVNACVFTATRIPLALARGHMFPAWFGGVTRDTATPVRAVLVVTLATAAYAILGGFDALLGIFSFAVWIFYGLSAVALLLFRHRRVGEPLAWRAPGGFVPPAVVLLVAAYVTVGVLRDDPKHALIGFAILLAGFPVFWLWQRVSPR